MLELLKVKSLLFIQNDAILFLLLVAEERGERRISCKRRKKVGNSGRKTRLFAEYIFSFIYKLHQKAWNSSTWSKKNEQQQNKKKKIVPGLTAKQLCLSKHFLL